MDTGCFFAVGGLAIFVSGIFGLGWLVIQPLGKINRTRVTTARFQLFDLLLLLLLLQPSLAWFGWLLRASRDSFESPWLILFALVCGVTAAAWYGMTGALSKAGITNTAKRAVAVLIILPMISAAIPTAIVIHFAVAATALQAWEDRSFSIWVVLGCVLAEVGFVGALFGCRRLSRWIASEIHLESMENNQSS